MESKKFYITTAIAYTSGKPHIGNVYEIVLADSIARFMRLSGYDVYFQTGTDEHGQKIETNAKAAGLEVQEFVDKTAIIVKDIWDTMGVSYDAFVRTTDPQHKMRVQKIFRKLYEQDDIYKGEYEGMYCSPCESFFTESQLKDGKCPDCGAEVSYAKEEAYFFRMSKYQQKLEDHIENHPEFIQPDSRKNEMLNNFIKPGLKDLCVSRTSFKWGIPVDFDSEHVIYVWIDALSNYITFLGYNIDGENGDLFEKYWPCDIHLIGKDILRFHTIYWPIILMALGEELPKKVLGHPWLLVGEGKMSKSKRNVIYADDLVKEYGLDAVRFFLLKEIPFAQDGSFTYELLIERINGELVNILGNLVNRTAAMAKLYFESYIPSNSSIEESDGELIELINKTPEIVSEKMHEYKVADAINAIFALLRRSNKYIDETTPWLLAKDETKKSRLATVLYNLFESIRVSGVLLGAFLPQTSEKILKLLNTEQTSFESLSYGNLEKEIKMGESEILFARIEVKDEKKVKQAEKIEKIDEISIDEFAKTDLRIGEILEAKKHPDADKLLVFKVAVGADVRQIVSGIANYYEPNELVGKKVIVVANLKPVNLRGELSQGMLLLAEDESGLTFVVPEKFVENGAKVK